MDGVSRRMDGWMDGMTSWGSMRSIDIDGGGFPSLVLPSFQAWGQLQVERPVASDCPNTSKMVTPKDAKYSWISADSGAAPDGGSDGGDRSDRSMQCQARPLPPSLLISTVNPHPHTPIHPPTKRPYAPVAQ